MAKAGSKRKHDYDAVLRFIITYKSLHDGNSPTLRQICEARHISSTSVTHRILLTLYSQGKLTALRPAICVAGGQWNYRQGVK